MYIFTTVTVFTIVADLVLADNNVNSNNDSAANTPRAIDNIPSDTTPKQTSEDTVPIQNSMWIYRPKLHSDSLDDDSAFGDRVLRPGVSVTRLAKSLYYGFDPYFHRTYFEPFESRSKPVRLVALNRNGKLPRQRFNMVINEQDLNTAELQSPFNEVGNFWLEETVTQQ